MIIQLGFDLEVELLLVIAIAVVVGIAAVVGITAVVVVAVAVSAVNGRIIEDLAALALAARVRSGPGLLGRKLVASSGTLPALLGSGGVAVG